MNKTYKTSICGMIIVFTCIGLYFAKGTLAMVLIALIGALALYYNFKY